MKVLKKKKIANVLKVDENFASLTKFDSRNGVSNYTFSYTIDSVKAINNGLTDVRVQIRPEEPVKPTSVFAATSLALGPVVKPKSTQIVANILLKNAKEKDVKSTNVSNVQKSLTTELTAKISNELATTVKGLTLSPFDIKPVNKLTVTTVSNIKSTNAETQPILQVSVLKLLPKKKTFPALTIASIFQEKKDPSEALALAKFVTPAQKSIQGLFQATTLKSKLPKMNIILANLVKADSATNTDDLIAEAIVPVLETRQDPIVRVEKTVDIKQSDLKKADSFFVTFELRNSGGIVVEKIERRVTHGKNIKVIQTPVIPPSVVAAPVSIVGRNVINIRQMDPNAVAVRMYRKIVFPTVRLEDLGYDFVEEILLSSGQGSHSITDYTNNVNNVIYRFIAVGPQGQPSAEFSNIISPAVRIGSLKKAERPIFAGLIASVVKDGIRIQLVNISPGPIAIKVVRRDRTKHEIKNSDFQIVRHETTDKEVVLIDGENLPGTFLDKNLLAGHLYEYCCILIYENGDEVLATGCDFIEYIPFSEGVAVTKASTPRVVNREGGVDVTFLISTRLLDKDLDIVKKLLEKQGLADLWQDELKNEKNALKELIAHQIRRVDLTTGKSEYFQTFTGDNFSDADNRAQSSVSPLIPGHRYRYYISALLRTPETLFEDNAIVVTNKAGVEISILPLKFKHPIALNQGTIVTPASLKTNHSKDPFEFGNIGNIKTVDVTLENLKPQLTRPRAIRFNNFTNIVRWEILGEKSLIDHFIILLDRNGQEEVVGKAHPIFDADFIEFVDKLDQKEIGSMRYRIIPVLTSYEHGSPIITNEVIV